MGDAGCGVSRLDVDEVAIGDGLRGTPGDCERDEEEVAVVSLDCPIARACNALPAASTELTKPFSRS